VTALVFSEERRFI